VGALAPDSAMIPCPVFGGRSGRREYLTGDSVKVQVLDARGRRVQ
jgi:hypothetical protein